MSPVSPGFLSAILGQLARVVAALLTLVALVAAAAGCGGRPAGWSAPAGQPQAIGLARSVALLDLPA